MIYNTKLQFVALQGINLTNFGEATCEHSREGDAITKNKGIQGDAVTVANYAVFDTFRITQQFDSPIKEQVENWEKNHTKLSFQYKDENTGATKTSTTAYIQSHTDSVDGGDWELIIYCEEVH